MAVCSNCVSSIGAVLYVARELDGLSARQIDAKTGGWSSLSFTVVGSFGLNDFPSVVAVDPGGTFAVLDTGDIFPIDQTTGALPGKPASTMNGPLKYYAGKLIAIAKPTP
jgi:hypothetical protein